MPDKNNPLPRRLKTGYGTRILTSPSKQENIMSKEVFPVGGSTKDYDLTSSSMAQEYDEYEKGTSVSPEQCRESKDNSCLEYNFSSSLSKNSLRGRATNTSQNALFDALDWTVKSVVTSPPKMSAQSSSVTPTKGEDATQKTAHEKRDSEPSPSKSPDNKASITIGELFRGDIQRGLDRLAYPVQVASKPKTRRARPEFHTHNRATGLAGPGYRGPMNNPELGINKPKMESEKQSTTMPTPKSTPKTSPEKQTPTSTQKPSLAKKKAKGAKPTKPSARNFEWKDVYKHMTWEELEPLHHDKNGNWIGTMGIHERIEQYLLEKQKREQEQEHSTVGPSDKYDDDDDVHDDLETQKGATNIDDEESDNLDTHKPATAVKDQDESY